MANNSLNFNSCTICEDSISDPVCKSCYIKQIKLLFNDFKFSNKTKEIILRKIDKKFPVETLNKTECILCHKEKVTICRYCFSVQLNKILRNLDFSEEKIEEFGFRLMPEEFYLEDEESFVPMAY